jgi:hypothetical protein
MLEWRRDLLAALTVADVYAIHGDDAAPVEPFGKQRRARSGPEYRGRVHGIWSSVHVIAEGR